MKTRKYLLAGLIAAALLALIPLYMIGTKAHPSVDDYFYGAETAAVWQDTHSVREVLAESFRQMKNSYENWQGNFSAIFLMRLQPGIFGENAYDFTAVILLTSFIASQLFFYYTAARKLFSAGRDTALAIALVLSFAELEFTRKASDSFYWFNGSIYYTFFFCLSHLLYALMIRLYFAKKQQNAVILLILSLIIGLLLGGGNFCTALPACLLLATVTLLLFFCRKKRALPFLLVTAAAGASLLFNILAPGNALRQASVGESTGILKTLIYSFAYGGFSLSEMISVPVLMVWLLLAPVFYCLAKKTDFTFPKPLLVLLYTFGLYSAQGTPIFYAEGLRMPYRISNIIGFNAYLFAAFNLAYFSGWLAKNKADGTIARSLGFVGGNMPRFARWTAMLALAFAVGCVGKCQVEEAEEGGASFTLSPLSAEAARLLLTKEASVYDRELSERAEYLSSCPENSEVTVPPLSVYPSVLVHSEITENTEDFKNQHLALYYRLKTVKLEPESSP